MKRRSRPSSPKAAQSRWAIGLTAVVAILSVSPPIQARPSRNSGSHAVQEFLRQLNTKSNVEFYFTNQGLLFNSGNKEEGLFWPRGSNVSYIFGGGIWIAAKKVVGGRRRKLCELGFDANYGKSWFAEGDSSQVGLIQGTDGASPKAKYISYVSPRYDRLDGKFIQGSSSSVPSPYYAWPLWDTASSKTFKRNFYFGDYISDVRARTPVVLRKNGFPAVPAMVSEEDVVNIYSDADTSNNPEFVAGKGYPFGIDIQEVIYSWSFGHYRDMIFVRWKVTNTTADTLSDCWLAPAFDPDLNSPESNGLLDDINSYVSDELARNVLRKDTADVFPMLHVRNHSIDALNMCYQRHTGMMRNATWGEVGFSFVEGTILDEGGNIIPNDDSTALGGYGGDGSLFANPDFNHGLTTFRKWTHDVDPVTADLRYDFIAAGVKDNEGGIHGDLRLIMSTGPFTLLPGNAGEATIAITFAQGRDLTETFHNLILETDRAHQFFGQVDSMEIGAGRRGYFINHFQTLGSESVACAPTVSNRSISCVPNPFTSDAVLAYALSSTTSIRIEIADVNGHLVRTLFEGKQTSGEYTVHVNGTELASGAYFVRVLEGDRTLSTQIVHRQ